MMFKKTLGSDNHSGIHPEMLKAISQVNESHSPSYGTDPISEKAQSDFKEVFGEHSRAFFVFNGTACNVLCLKALVKSYESIICTNISHLNEDECGAPENHIGAKLVTVPHENGKLTVNKIQAQLKRYGDQHYSQPKAVSITQPTEVGTVYSIEELKEISQFCKKNKLKLHVDGARYIIAAQSLDLTLKELTDIIQPDALSFGGTKNGLLFGEAAILFKKEDYIDFKFLRKQAMQLPSKMRFIAAQFICLLKIWPEIAKHEIEVAQYLEASLSDIKDIHIMYPVQSNAVFAKIPKSWTKPLKNAAFFYIWDEHEWVTRWMCSFNTTKEDIDLFVQEIHRLQKLDGL